MGRFAILEFGGQHTDLIGNVFRSMGHHVDYLKSSTPVSQLGPYDGIVLSGGPKSVNDPDAYPYDRRIFTTDEPPRLGDCYGMQLQALSLGSEVRPGLREYGESRLTVIKDHLLFAGLPREMTVWNNHGDGVATAGDFDILAYSDRRIIAAISKGKNVAVQFHPELTHTEYGTQILRNFAERICHAQPEFMPVESMNIAKYAEEKIYEMRNVVGRRKGLALVSGGVDSTAALMLACRAGIDLIAVHITGVERKGEEEEVKRLLEELSGQRIHVVDYEDRVIRALNGLYDPEDKRKAFQREYSCTDQLFRELGLNPEEVVPIAGDLATDIRESGMEAGKKGKDAGTVAKIKTHHNVTRYWYTDRNGQIKYLEHLAPLAELSKDGSRLLAAHLGLPPVITKKKPFPGPGNVLRVISGIYSAEAALEEGVAEIARKYRLDSYVLPIKTVGIKGDSRSFEHLALVSGERDWKSITRASKELAEELPINRTVYLDRRWADADVEQEQFRRVSKGLEFNRQNIALLQEATEIAERTFDEYGVKPAQLPVVAFPMPDGVGIAIRDVDSKNFRSVRPLKKPDEMPWELCDEVAKRMLESPEVRKYGEVKAVVFDASTKPAATTEWE